MEHRHGAEGIPGLNIADAVEAYYGPSGGYNSRFSQFYSGRFTGDPEVAKDIVCSGMVPGDDLLINAGRTALIYQQAGVFVQLPFWFTPGLDGFCEGFVEVLSQLAVEI